jgi:hypothetical protein
MDGHWIGFEVKDNLEQAVAIVYDVDRMLEAYASKRE